MLGIHGAPCCHLVGPVFRDLGVVAPSDFFQLLRQGKALSCWALVQGGLSVRVGLRWEGVVRAFWPSPYTTSLEHVLRPVSV